MNPKVYCLKHNMTSAEFIKKMAETFPKYSKATHSMASAPEKYGVTLSAKAKALLTPEREKKRNMYRVSARLTKDMHEAYTRLKTAWGIETNQDMLVYLIEKALEKERDRSDCGSERS